MSLYAIGDLHLSLDGDKPMDVFGRRWEDHVEKLREGFSRLGPEDVTVLCGDLSWAMNIDGARKDFLFIHSLPGKKIVLKGNHDYWWSTATKAYSFFEENGIDSIEILNNNCVLYGETAICGTRGWFYEEERGDGHDRKIMARELLRLEASLRAAGDREKIVFLHYPPKYGSYECAGILSLLERHTVRRCCYGHLHGRYHSSAFQGVYRGTEYSLVSADYLSFSPKKIL